MNREELLKYKAEKMDETTPCLCQDCGKLFPSESNSGNPVLKTRYLYGIPDLNIDFFLNYL